MPKGHNDFVATPQLNQFGAAYTPLNETDYSGGQSAGANVFGGGINESTGVGQNQSAFAQQLMNQANGIGGPSVAQQQLQQGLAQNQAQAAGSIASQRGLNPALAARLIGNQQAAAGQTAAGQSAMLRSQEMLNAQSQLGQALALQRQGAQGQAGLGSQLFNIAGGLQNQQNQIRSGANLGTQQLNLQGALANQNALQNAQSLNAGVEQQNTNAQNAIAGNVLNAAGAVVGGVVAGPVGAAAGSKVGSVVGGGQQDIAQAPQMMSSGGPVPGVEPERIQSFAELVAHHLTHQSHAAHKAMFGPVPASLARGGVVKMTPADLTDADKEGMDLDLDKPSKAKSTRRSGDKALQEPKGYSDGGTPDPLLDRAGGLNPQDTLAEFQAAIKAGGNPSDVYANMSTKQKYALASLTPGGNDLLLRGNSIPRQLVGAGNSAISPGNGIPLAQGQQSVPTPQLFNPGNFGGLATTNAAAQAPAPVGAPAGQPIGSALRGGFGQWGSTPAGLGQAIAQGYKPPTNIAVPVPAPMGASAPAGVMGVRSPPVTASSGAVVPGQASVKGDSAKNDTVPARLSPGEVVLPRSISNHPDKAKEFVKHLIATGQIAPHEYAK